MQRILTPTIIQYLNLHATTLSAQNVIVYDSHHDPHFENRFSCGKRQFLTPRLLRYLQLVNEQSLSHIFESSEAKTQETVELVRTLPERTVSQIERMKNPLILPNNMSTKSNFLSSSVVKTQSDGIQLDEKDNLLKLQHHTTPDISPFDEFKTVSAETRVGNNTKAKDIILHSSTHADENILKTDTMMAHVQKRNRLVYEKHENLSRRTADRYLMPEKKNIANRFVSNTYIARLRMVDMEAEGAENSTRLNQLSKQDGISLQHVKNAQKDVSVPFDLSSSNIARRASDLVLRKDALQKSNEELDNPVKSDTITTGINKTTNVEKDAVDEKNVKPRNSVENIGDITIIADRVYKLLESKISIEKERRGLR
jgi:hypothetical protein